MLKTKIYGTIGPASYQTEILIEMINSGLDGIRINLSHGELSLYNKWVSNIKKAELKTNKKIPIIADIQGPEIRIGSLKKKAIPVYTGNKITLVSGKGKGDDKKLYISWPNHISSSQLEKYIKKGEKILIDDGLIILEVISVENKQINCHILQGGILNKRKGINIPAAKLPFSSLTEKDKDDLELGIKLGIDFVMLPFTRTIEDVNLIREYLNAKNGEGIGILAKIENQEGIDNLETFIEQVNGIVIARGDLGVEISLYKIPFVQKELIKICQRYKKESIVVTHLLHSMIQYPQPTRAEISDIANAVLDGCSGVMLTGETAIGKYPLRSIRTLHDTVVETEKWKEN